MSIGDYSDLYTAAGKKYGISPNILMAQGQIESSGNPSAYNDDTGASGLAQLIPSTAKSLGVTDPTDPAQAIDAQARLMKQNIDRYGDPKTALLAYHGGTDTSQWGPKTKAYAGKVMELAQNDDIQNDNGPLKISIPNINSDDPIEAALMKRAADKVTAPSDNSSAVDPIETALMKRASEKSAPIAQSAASIATPTISTAEDLALTAPSSFVKGVNAIPQWAAMGGNAIANTMGEGTYLYNRLINGAPKDDVLYNRLTNINPFFTGNTIADTGLQTANALLQNPAPANSLTSSVIHDPQTAAGRFENALIMGVVGGKAGGGENVLAQGGKIALPTVSLPKAIGGGFGADIASEVFPGSPSAQLAGGGLGYMAGGQVSPNPLSAEKATLYKSGEENHGIKIPTSMMSDSPNLLEAMAGKADTSQMEAQVNKKAADLIGANDNGGNHTALNKNSFSEAKANNIAEINRIDSSIGDVPMGGHAQDIDNEILNTNQKRFFDLSKEIDAAKNPNGTISASAIRALTGFGSKLRTWAESSNEDIREPAQAIIKSLKSMIKDNATPNQLEDLTSVNNKYKLMSDFEKISNESGISRLTQPAIIRDTINKSYDSINDYRTPAKEVGNLLNEAIPGRKYINPNKSPSGIFNPGNGLTHAEVLGSLLSSNPMLGLAMIAAPKIVSRAASAITNSDLYRNSLLQNAQ